MTGPGVSLALTGLDSVTRAVCWWQRRERDWARQYLLKLWYGDWVSDHENGEKERAGRAVEVPLMLLSSEEVSSSSSGDMPLPFTD